MPGHPAPPVWPGRVFPWRVSRASPCKLSLPVRPQPITWPSLDKHNIVTTQAAGPTLKEDPLRFFLPSFLGLLRSIVFSSFLFTPSRPSFPAFVILVSAAPLPPHPSCAGLSFPVFWRPSCVPRPILPPVFLCAEFTLALIHSFFLCSDLCPFFCTFHNV